MKKNTHQQLGRNANASPAPNELTTNVRITISLSEELARPEDDLRRQTAVRWQAALHRLCLLRATMNETPYEIEWASIFDEKRALDDASHHSQMLAIAALDVLQVQHEYKRMVFQAEGVEYDPEVGHEIS